MEAKIITILMITIVCWNNPAHSVENQQTILNGTNLNKGKVSEKLARLNTYDNPDNRDSGGNGMETLSGGNPHSGGYGALFFKGSSFNGTSIAMMGIRGAWVVNRSFGLGIDLNGLLPISKYDDVDPVEIRKAILVGGYGGFLLEPIVWSKKLVHVTFPISFGAGWLGYVEDWENDQYYSSGDLLDNDVFWYIEPGICAEVNVTNYFRIDVGISKRFTQDLSLYNTPSDAFDKLNYSLTLKFGGF